MFDELVIPDKKTRPEGETLVKDVDPPNAKLLLDSDEESFITTPLPAVSPNFQYPTRSADFGCVE